MPGRKVFATSLFSCNRTRYGHKYHPQVVYLVNRIIIHGPKWQNQEVNTTFYRTGPVYHVFTPYKLQALQDFYYFGVF